MHKVLDLDLDFFVFPGFDDTGHGDVTELSRPPATEFEHIATEAEVREFLEGQCGLSTTRPLPGREAAEHVEAFTTWHQWLTSGTLVEAFDVVHIDAHSDLGSGLWNKTYRYVSTEFLALPLEARRQPRVGPRYANSGNYLIFAIANRWLRNLTYVYPIDPAPKPPIPNDPLQPMTMADRLSLIRSKLGIKDDDAPPPPFLAEWCFRNGDYKTGTIELHQYPHTEKWWEAEPIHTEPSVHFEAIESSEFSDTGFTHLFLARSPQYAPQEADFILDIVREYFRET